MRAPPSAAGVSTSARIALGWVAGALAIAVAFAFAVWRDPTDAAATGGEDPSRLGLVALALAIPIVLTALRLGRFAEDDHPTAACLLPAAVGLGVAILMVLVGFLPEDALRCRQLAQRGIATGPECTTSPSARLWALAEATAIWLVFGVLLLATRRWVPRRRAPV